MKKILFLLIIALFLAGCVSKKGEINNFMECVESGFPAIETSPRQCSTPDGLMFVEEAGGPSCEDRCGDGVCQLVVCTGKGCPCPETGMTCTEDCSK